MPMSVVDCQSGSAPLIANGDNGIPSTAAPIANGDNRQPAMAARPSAAPIANGDIGPPAMDAQSDRRADGKRR